MRAGPFGSVMVVATDAVRAQLPDPVLRTPRLESARDVAELPPRAIVLLGPADPLLPAVRVRQCIAALMVVDESEPELDADGIDDYLFAPVTAREIVARGERALLRGRAVDPPSFVLDEAGVRMGSVHVSLSNEQVRLVEQLIAADGAPLSASELSRALGIPSLRKHALEARVGRLRRRLHRLNGVRIEMLRQRGYRLVVDSLPHR